MPPAAADGRRGAAPPARAVRHGQSARPRARGPGVPRAPPARRGARGRARGPGPERPNLVARLRGADGGRCSGCFPTSTRWAPTRPGWRHDPWSGDLAEGCVWGRGALDMKSQTAAEVVAACSLARSGARLAGDLLVICVADEEVGGTGAEWLCERRPDVVRCDFLLGEGDGAQTDVGGRRLYGVSVADKGVFRFTLTTRRAGRPRLDPDDRRQRAAQAGAAAAADGRPAPCVGRHPGARAPARRPRRSPSTAIPPPRWRRCAPARPTSRRWSRRCCASRSRPRWRRRAASTT